MSKPTLVILPGWGGTRQTWADFIALAEPDFAVHCVELPCFGAEPEPPAVWGVEEYANFVKVKISQIKSKTSVNQRLVILGHSFGGQVAVQLVGTNPGICDTLILSGAAIFRQKKSFKRLLFWPIAKVGKLLFSLPGLRQLASLARRALYKAADSPDYLATSGIQRQIFQRVTTQDVSALLPRISVPTLVIAGEKDSYVSAASSRRVANAISHSRFVLVPHGRHGLHRDNLENFLRIIISF